MGSLVMKKIELSLLVTVTDDDTATVIFDDSSVDYNKAGSYEAYYLSQRIHLDLKHMLYYNQCH